MFRMEYILVWRVSEPTGLASPTDCERVIAKGARFGTCCLARALDREMAGPACQKTCDAHEALLGTPAV